MRPSLTRRRGLVLVAATAAAAAALGAVLTPHSSAGSPAPAARLRAVSLACGSTVTTSVTLATDLTDCPGRGVTVAAAHVTLNLNGHTISGQGSFYGVYVSSGSVTVENGTIHSFSVGVQLFGDGSRAQNLRISNVEDGIDVGENHHLITGNTIFNTAGFGIFDNGANNQYTSNTVQGAGSQGISLSGANETVGGNKVLSSGTEGIQVDGAGAKLTGNVANGNGGDGILVTTARATLSANQAFFNTKLGIAAAPGDTDASGNKASGNGALHQCADVVCS
jgi:Periplasmic copper-binding protein (NosD)